MSQVMEYVKVGDVRPAEDNLRKGVGDVKDLTQSVKSQGILEPLVVVPGPGGTFTIVAGHRRFEAAKEAKLSEVPVIVRNDLTETDRLEIMLVENLQREDLTPIEEAQAYQRLIEIVGSQRQLTERVGRSQAHISKRLSLLKLPAKIQTKVVSGSVSIEDALQLVRLDDASEMEAVLKRSQEDSFTNIRVLVDRADGEKQRQAKIAAAWKKAEDAGFTVIPQEDWEMSSSKVKIVGEGELEDVKPAAHAKLDCAAVGIDRLGKVVPLCTDPKKHIAGEAKPKTAKERQVAADHDEPTEASDEPEPIASKKMTAAAKKDEQYKLHQKALRDARGDREDLISQLLQKPGGKRIAKATLFDFVMASFLDSASSNDANRACKLLGIENKLEAVEASSASDSLKAYAKDSPDALNRAVLALAFAMNEGELTGNWTAWGVNDSIKRHYEMLESLGYELAPSEKKELAGKAPRRAGD